MRLCLGSRSPSFAPSLDGPRHQYSLSHPSLGHHSMAHQYYRGADGRPSLGGTLPTSHPGMCLQRSSGLRAIVRGPQAAAHPSSDLPPSTQRGPSRHTRRWPPVPSSIETCRHHHRRSIIRPSQDRLRPPRRRPRILARLEICRRWGRLIDPAVACPSPR